MNAIQQELEQIRTTDPQGMLKPEAIVEYASDPDTVLHDHFTWDDTIAAHQYRLWQARQMIRVQVRMVTQIKKPIRTYVSLVEDRHMLGGYRTLVDVMADDTLQQKLLGQAREDAQRYRAKYRLLVQLAPIWGAMDEVFDE